MLRTVKENQPAGIIRLSEILGIPKHKVRYSLRLLEQEDLILPSNEGAKVTDRYEDFMASMETSLDDLWKRIDAIRALIPRT
jgi:predicted transcriptional regulator